MKNKIYITGIVFSTLFCSSLFADKTEEFVKNILKKNPTIQKILQVETVGRSNIGTHWYRDVVKINVVDSTGSEHEEFIPVLTDGEYFSENVYDEFGNPIANKIVMPLDKLYKESSLIYAPEDRSKIKNRVAIFSDFECPFCNQKAPSELQRFVDSDDTAIYYYNLPLTKIHPNSKNISLVAITAMQKYPDKKIDILYGMYAGKDFQYKDGEQKESLDSIITKYNSILPDYQITKKDVEKYKAKEILESDRAYSAKINVSTTPTVFINGKRVIRTH